MAILFGVSSLLPQCLFCTFVYGKLGHIPLFLQRRCASSSCTVRQTCWSVEWLDALSNTCSFCQEGTQQLLDGFQFCFVLLFFLIDKLTYLFKVKQSKCTSIKSVKQDCWSGKIPQRSSYWDIKWIVQHVKKQNKKRLKKLLRWKSAAKFAVIECIRLPCFRLGFRIAMHRSVKMTSEWKIL